MRLARPIFDVEIVGPQVEPFWRGNYRYASMPSHTTYRIKLINSSDVRADADISIDGQAVGTWRVRAQSEVTIERPEGVNRAFTLVDEGGGTARRTGARVGDDYNGLVSVVFKPAKRGTASPRPARAVNVVSPRSAAPTTAAPSSLRSSGPMTESLSSGVTVLGRRSSQEFSQVPSLSRDEIDWNRVTEVDIRLVIRTVEWEPEYVPLSRGVPPRIDRYTYGGGGSYGGGRVD